METASVTSTNTVSLEISRGNRVIIDKGSIHCHFRLWYLWEFLPQPNRDNSRLCCSKITKWGEILFPSESLPQPSLSILCLPTPKVISMSSMPLMSLKGEMPVDEVETFPHHLV